MTMRVEYILAFDDHTWETVVVAVPDFLTSVTNPNHDVLVDWANDNLLTQARFRKAQFCAVFNAPFTLEKYTKYDLLDVDEGDECPLCECGTVGHERRGEGKHSTLIAVCRGECGENITIPDFICPKCRTIYGGVAVQHRLSIEENGWCLDCEVEKAPFMDYKVWVSVEEICEDLDHYQDVDLSYSAVAKFNRRQPAIAFADMLHHLGKVVDGAMLALKAPDRKTPPQERANQCWSLVSRMLEDPSWRRILDKHAPTLVEEALSIFEEEDDG